ncbi:ATP-binding protein [Sphingomonas sp. CFBP 8760]|uniref:ATP-binding protein n=1 Tax=Sphingomonas sp. CFBP 8760 TaxID=2775282 RepID=UPI00178006C8|nr:hypothetical protein [Sphingomonas sp. CFBP 8760]
MADDGLGIHEQDRERAVQRFARLDRERDDGHGLGLNLVAAISAAHGGAMRLKDNHPGLRVIVTLPCNKTHPATADYSTAAGRETS